MVKFLPLNLFPTTTDVSLKTNSKTPLNSNLKAITSKGKSKSKKYKKIIIFTYLFLNINTSLGNYRLTNNWQLVDFDNGMKGNKLVVSEK